MVCARLEDTKTFKLRSMESWPSSPYDACCALHRGQFLFEWFCLKVSSRMRSTLTPLCLISDPARSSRDSATEDVLWRLARTSALSEALSNVGSDCAVVPVRSRPTAVARPALWRSRESAPRAAPPIASFELPYSLLTRPRLSSPPSDAFLPRSGSKSFASSPLQPTRAHALARTCWDQLRWGTTSQTAQTRPACQEAPRPRFQPHRHCLIRPRPKNTNATCAYARSVRAR